MGGISCFITSGAFGHGLVDSCLVMKLKSTTLSGVIGLKLDSRGSSNVVVHLLVALFPSIFFFFKMVELVGGGSVINGAYPV